MSNTRVKEKLNYYYEKLKCLGKMPDLLVIVGFKATSLESGWPNKSNWKIDLFNDFK